MSLIFYPDFLKPVDLFLFQINISLTVLDVVRAFLPEAKTNLKWPNDIYVADHKIGGLLIQSGIRGQEIEYLVVGIGLNVNQTHFPNNLNYASSLALFLKAEQDLDLIRQKLKDAIEADYRTFKDHFLNEKFKSELLSRYEKYLYQLNEWKTYLSSDGKAFEGKILGVFEDGHLKLLLRNGETHKFYFKEILFSHT
jgi:BirA family transcriptional regulator, biotin operon repressor / biotin---[acetyl-CoA-carboxylase] ligase